MPESRNLAEYRLRLILIALSKIGKTHFDSVIDFGSGKGDILRGIVQSVGAKKAKGIDIIGPEISSDRIVLQRTNMLEYEPKEQYQLVISNQLFEHIYEPYLPRYFHILKESCEPKGIILISTPNRWRPKNIIRLLSLRRPYMMSPNKGVPPEQHRGHHRECSYRELRSLLDRYFPGPEWHVTIMRMAPRMLESQARWVTNVLIYSLLWFFWRPLVVSASQDHYVIIERHCLEGADSVRILPLTKA